ncbi:MAG: Plug domain-containing protein [Nitrospirota bacterium]
MNRARIVNIPWTLLAGIVMAVIGTVPSVTWGAEEPAGREATELTMKTVKVEGQRIENVNDVKKEFARRPGSNILIEEKQIVQSRALNLQDVLQFAPGVRFQSRTGADEGQFSIRGTSLRNNFHHRGINILINGIYFGDADGFSDFESIDLLAYERIEVYKGANALRYGGNTIGGAINLFPGRVTVPRCCRCDLWPAVSVWSAARSPAEELWSRLRSATWMPPPIITSAYPATDRMGFRITVNRPGNASMPT